MDSTPLLPLQSQLLCCLQRIAARDQAALAELYDATIGKVFGVALRIVGDHCLAEEVVSDVYLQAWVDTAKYDAARGPVQAWLLVICRSRALDAWRKRGAASAAAGCVGAEFDSNESVPDLLETTQRHWVVHRALAQLEPVQRQLLGLAFFRGLSHSEIATHLGMPIGTVKTVIRLALRRLRAGTEMRALAPDAAPALLQTGQVPVRRSRAGRPLAVKAPRLQT